MSSYRTLFRSARCSALLAAIGIILCLGCDNNPSGKGEGGEILFNVASIPEDVTCVRVTASGDYREVVRDFDVSPGATLSEGLSGLPVGSVIFSASAYATDCASVTKSTVPTWISDQKTVNVVQGKSSSITLALYKNGRVKVTVEFADQEDGGTDARPDARPADGGTRD
jgi:hypothetical protein